MSSTQPLVTALEIPKVSPDLKYHRVLLKLSGEALKREGELFGPEIVGSIATQIREVYEMGVQLSLVVGGGNIFRGTSPAASTMNRSVADQVGMLATLINSIVLQTALEDIGVPTRVCSAIEVSAIAEQYIRRRAIRHLEKGRVVIFACGTGNPYFSTDSAAALRGNEIDAEVVLKATNVDGVYDSDPRKNPDAKRYEKLTFDESISRELKVMDATAFTMCRENDLPIIIFDLHQPGNIRRVLTGEPVGTLITKSVD